MENVDLVVGWYTKGIYVTYVFQQADQKKTVIIIVNNNYLLSRIPKAFPTVHLALLSQ